MASVVTRSPYQVEARGPLRATLIFLHGLGDQGDGWSQILARSLSSMNIKIVCPNAASRPVTLQFGMQLPAWYDLKGLSPDSPEDVEGINAATAYVHSLIKREIDGGLDAKKIVVGGFSMGGALAIHSALTYPQRIGAVVALSGFLLQRDAIKAACTHNMDLPTFLGHGRNDVLVPYTFGEQTRDRLLTFNKVVEFHPYDCDHSTTEQELSDVCRFIKKNLSL